MELHSFATYI